MHSAHAYSTLLSAHYRLYTYYPMYTHAAAATQPVLQEFFRM